jgi:tetratricopeptide (TPR) repeat protein
MLAAVLLLLASSSASPNQFQARLQEAAAALDANDLGTAQANLEKATQLAPKHAGAWLLLAQTYARQKKQTSALAAAQKAERFAAADAKILQGLANFYATLVPDYPKAAALGARYAELSPADRTAWRRLAAFCLSTNQPDKSIEAAKRALAMDDSAEAHSILGQAYEQRKDWPNAVAELKTALAMSRFDENAHFRLAQAYLLQQDFPSAIKVLESARATFDKSPQIELALGVAYYGMRRFGDTITQFLKTIDLAPDIPQPYLFLGRIMEHAQDRMPELTQRFAEFQARNPNSSIGYLLHAKGIIAQLPSSGFPAEAQRAYDLLQKSISLKEDDAEAHLQLGILLERKREYDQARKHLERAVQLNPNGSAAHYRLARVYERLGRKEDAEQQRALHEKLSEAENAAGPEGFNIPAPRPSSPAQP